MSSGTTTDNLEPSEHATSSTSLRSIVISTISGLCSIGLLPLLGLCATWIFDVEVKSSSMAVLQAAMGYILLAAYPVFLFAVIAKRKFLGVVAAFVIMCHVFFYAPLYTLAEPLPASANSAPKFTLLSHNVRYDNPTPSRIIDEIQQTDADIVFIQEMTDPMYRLWRSSGALDPYPYEFNSIDNGAQGLAIFSKFPFLEKEIFEGPGFPQQRAVVEINGRELILWNVHTKSPVGGAISQWKGDLDHVQSRLHSENGDVLMAGDFNATWSHKPFRDIIRDGVREVANDRGRGHSRTWPVDKGFAVKTDGFIRIDHVLTKNNIRATSIREGAGNGSDHRSTITELALLP